jgi:hypothetical protein
MTSYVDFRPSTECWIWYWPAGVSNRLPSGVKVRRLKKDVKVSFAYRLAFFVPKLRLGLGDGSIGITAGKGNEGAGEADRRDENDERLLWLTTLGGFMGNGNDDGVPGAEGTGEPTEALGVSTVGACARKPISGGAGLLAEIRRGGKSILAWLAILVVFSSWLLRVYWPSFVLREYI